MILFLLVLIPLRAELTFNKSHGVYKSPFMLRISSNESGAVIRYTLDGSEPTATSLQFSGNIYVGTTLIVRAAEFKNGQRISDIVTSSYIFPSSVLEQPDAPDGYPATWGKYSTISGTAPADYGMDPELTADRTYATNITEAFYSIPALSIVTDKENLFNKTYDEQTGGIYIYTGTSDSDGRGWERAASVELMGGGHDLTTACGLKIHGGQGRVPEKNPKHSFRLTFKDEYGKKTLKYPVFGEENVARFNSLIVRTFYNYSWIHSDATQRSRAQYARDLWSRRMQKRMGYAVSDGLYVNVFLNGLYWGLYNLSERIDDDYCKYHFGGLKSDYDVIKREDYLEASEGTLDKWNQLMRLSEKASSQQTYEMITGQQPLSPDTVPEVLLDVDNFMDYMLINQYGGNADWDHHNWIAVCNHKDCTQGFRFICWDSEQTLFSASKNVLDINNRDCPTYLFQNLMKNRTFRHRFMDRAYKHLEDDGGLLCPQSTQALWDSLQSVISLAIYAESARWGDYRKDVHPYTSRGELYRADVHHTLENRRLHEEFFPQRTDNLIAQLKKKGWYATVEAPAFLVNGKRVADGDTINLSDDLTLSQGSYIVYTTDGSYPVSWVETTLGEETPQATLYSKENLAQSLVPGEVTLRAISKSNNNWSPTVTRKVFVVDDVTDGINEELRVKNEEFAGAVYDISGRRINSQFIIHNSQLKKGVYIRNGKKEIR
jgi:hypothetical protein